MMGLEIILEIAIPFDILEELLVCKISENWHFLHLFKLIIFTFTIVGLEFHTPSKMDFQCIFLFSVFLSAQVDDLIF
jgi:hypothetical protein